jgi:hypothetical protein
MAWRGSLLRWSLEPQWLRTKTKGPFVPQGVESVDAVLQEFLAQQKRLLEALRSGEGLDLGAGRITSPFDSRVRYGVFAAFRILETHGRRHLRQAAQALGHT